MWSIFPRKATLRDWGPGGRMDGWRDWHGWSEGGRLVPAACGILAAAAAGAAWGFVAGVAVGAIGLLAIPLLEARRRRAGMFRSDPHAASLEAADPWVLRELGEAGLAIARIEAAARERSLPPLLAGSLGEVGRAGEALVSGARRDPKAWTAVRSRALHGLRDAAVIADGLSQLARRGGLVPASAPATLSALARTLDGARATLAERELEQVEARLRLLEQELGPPPWAGRAATRDRD